MPFNLGLPELLVIMLLALLVFGAKRLPEIGSSLGKGIREFKRSIRSVKEDLNEVDDDVRELDAGSRQMDGPAEDRAGEPKKLSE